MSHPQAENTTPFVFETLFVADEEMRPIVVAIVKATFRFDESGCLRLDEEQLPVNVEGELAHKTPSSSYKYEPEIAFHKPGTDVVLVGHVRPPDHQATQVDVGIKVGPVRKLARVFGDRYWVRVNGDVRVSRTRTLDPVALTWENAFGGRDEKRSTPERPVFESRNPVGTGFGMPLSDEGEHLKLPNIEDPAQLISAYGEVVAPTGFGFTSPQWEPRVRFAGTYDEGWDATRKPMLPLDFDRAFFNAAAPGLIAPGYLRGDEDVVLLNVGDCARQAFRLPSIAPPICRVVLRGERDAMLLTNLDTVIVNTDEQRLVLVWRTHTHVANGPHDVSAIAVSMSA